MRNGGGINQDRRRNRELVSYSMRMGGAGQTIIIFDNCMPSLLARQRYRRRSPRHAGSIGGGGIYDILEAILNKYKRIVAGRE